MSALMSDALFAGFETHVERLKAARNRRQEVLAFKSALEEPASTAENEGGADQTQDELDGLGVRLPTDRWQGDVNMRTLEKLLARVDARGYERHVHPNPLRLRRALHTASRPCQVRAAARVPHGLHEGRKPRHIPQRLGDGPAHDHGEVWLGHVQVGGADKARTLLETYTRTHALTIVLSFFCAQHSAPLRKDVLVGVCALKKNTRRAPSSRPPHYAPSRPRTESPSSAPAWPFPSGSRLWSSVSLRRSNLASPASGLHLCVCVCVLAGPARRASRKLLERIVEFVRLAGGESKIVEFNQEACRLHSFDGKKSLIRSFP